MRSVVISHLSVLGPWPRTNRRPALFTLRILLAAALLCGPAWAQANDVKIGFVSTERLFREAAPAVRALKKLEKEFAPRDAEVQKLTKKTFQRLKWFKHISTNVQRLRDYEIGTL